LREKPKHGIEGEDIQGYRRSPTPIKCRQRIDSEISGMLHAASNSATGRKAAPRVAPRVAPMAPDWSVTVLAAWQLYTYAANLSRPLAVSRWVWGQRRAGTNLRGMRRPARCGMTACRFGIFSRRGRLAGPSAPPPVLARLEGSQLQDRDWQRPRLMSCRFAFWPHRGANICVTVSREAAGSLIRSLTST
jgi:hypothetical protein